MENVSYLLLYSKYSPGCKMLFEKYKDVSWGSFCKVITIDNEDSRFLLKKGKLGIVPILIIAQNEKIEQVYQGWEEVANWMEQVKQLNLKNNQTSISNMPPVDQQEPGQQPGQMPPEANHSTSIMDQQQLVFDAPPEVPAAHPSQARNKTEHIKRGVGHENMKGGSSLIPAANAQQQPMTDIGVDIGGLENFDQKAAATTSLMADVTQELPDVSAHKNRVQDGKKTDIKSAVAAMAAERENDIQMIENMEDFMKNEKRK